MPKKLGKISEVFASIQGEGYTMGSMQLFIRTFGCNIRCRNCSVKEHLEPEDSFTIRPWPGQRMIRVINPISAKEFYEKIREAFPLEKFHSVALTGGEPLFQTDFLLELLPYFKKENIPVFVETNGTLYNEFKQLKPLVSLWSVDLKLSSKWGLNTKNLMKKHKKFFELMDHESCYVRITLDSNDDAEHIFEQVNEFDLKKYSLVIQPFTKAPSHVNDWDTNTILEWISLFSPLFSEVRWIPQVHKLLRIP